MGERGKSSQKKIEREIAEGERSRKKEEKAKGCKDTIWDEKEWRENSLNGNEVSKE